MTPDSSRPVADQVQAVADTVLSGLQRRLPYGVDRHLPAALRRSTPPGDPALWLDLGLDRLHPDDGALDAPDYTRAATAVTATAQLWARTDITHRPTTADRATTLGALAARLSRNRPAAELDFARALRAHTLEELLPRLRPLLQQASGLSLDFSLMARDFYTLQSPGGPHAVGQGWAHAFTEAKARARRTHSTGKADPA
ncbi:type I-E CRISPR-associated protein Cse2/CasB [Streptomyces sp. MMBL 11-1]|uniref:type I-E CRISPR-associated protein Cse2/CasB n=1 Tax=Streptomyces sp. MMBL 11-1 TaxID=3026420 RepID=UPI00235FB441|nr:type I-E CRISPR-associated protein Cse2/CasB [Streptomyces sp. MMBL 11-1]